MNENIKVSVIIPCYNSERFLKECLDSILDQTLREIEIICVDDGSTDGTLGILHEYAQNDKRVQILNQKNQYAGVARNNGMDVSTGKYLSFLDSDDFFEPTMLEKMYEKCEKDEADICLCGAGIYDMKTGRVSYRELRPQYRFLPDFVPFSRIDIPKFIFNFTNPAPWNKLFKASFIKEYALKYQALQRANDVYFTRAAMAVASRITLVDEWLVNYRTGTSTSLQETTDNDPLCFYDASKGIKSFLIQHEIFNELEESFVKDCVGMGLHVLRKTKSKEQWLKVAFFLKEHYIPEFGLWENRKYVSSWREASEVMSLLMENDHAKLAEYNPDLRKDEVTAIQERDVAWEFPLDNNPLKVSVIIPVYNTEKFVEECLRSVLRQTLCDIEIICVNDGSTDNSLKIIEQIAKEDSRIRIICQKNQGLSITRNNALKVAKGEYIMFLDSDDLLVWCTLEHLYRQAKYHDLDDIFCEAISFFDPIELHKDHPYRINMYDFKGDYPEPVPGRELIRKMIEAGDLRSSACLRLFKRNFLEENELFFQEGIIHEDEIFTIRSLSVAKRTWVHKEPLYLRRIRLDSIMTREKSWKNVYGYYMCILGVEELLIKENSEYRTVLERMRSVYKQSMLNAYNLIPEKNWLDFPKEMTKPMNVHIPATLSFMIKLVQREATLVQQEKNFVKKEKQLNEIYSSRSWKLAKAISGFYQLPRRIFSVFVDFVKPIILRSKILTPIAYRIHGFLRKRI